MESPESKSIDFHLNEYFISEVMNLIYQSTRHSILTNQTHHSNPKKVKPNPSSSNHPELSSNNPNEEPSSVDDLEPEIHQSFVKKIDQIGYKIGWILSERLIREKPRLSRNLQYTSSNGMFVPDSLEVIKFICKELWLSIYNKQVDNLRTNHRGVYVLQDYGFKPFLKISINSSSPTSNPSSTQQQIELKSYIHKMLMFPSGIIRGSLMNLGIQSQVIPDQSAIPPQCSIQIRTILNPQVPTPTTNQSKPPNSSTNPNSNQTSPIKQVPHQTSSSQTSPTKPSDES